MSNFFVLLCFACRLLMGGLLICVVGMELQDFFGGLRGDMAKLYI